MQRRQITRNNSKYWWRETGSQYSMYVW